MNQQTVWSKENLASQVTFDVHADQDSDIHSGTMTTFLTEKVFEILKLHKNRLCLGTYFEW